MLATEHLVRTFLLEDYALASDAVLASWKRGRKEEGNASYEAVRTVVDNTFLTHARCC